MHHMGNRILFEDFKAAVTLKLDVSQEWEGTTQLIDFSESVGLRVHRGTCLQWLKEIMNDGQIICRTVSRGNLQWHISTRYFRPGLVVEKPERY